MNSFRSTNDLLDVLFSRTDGLTMDKSLKIVSAWKEILGKIQENKNNNKINTGAMMADHSKIADIKNGVLFIEADHPGWIQKLQINANFILKELRRKFPDLNIRSMSFRMSKNSVSCDSSPKESKNEKTAEISADTNKIEENISKQIDKKLPKELQNVLCELGKSILTKQ
ncbi:MAG: DUF721 domain-containing protein [Bacteroides sp.]|nr:DUF721 domain-containing protein [Prevotella sp.]MCM1408815.1 DUF721 domain-containing protein [Treponema brennaborense]MCM1470595.1 DUF721 domain-containing protein [Bacteroides sp.]